MREHEHVSVWMKEKLFCSLLSYYCLYLKTNVMTVLSSVVAGEKELSTNNSRQPRTVIGLIHSGKYRNFKCLKIKSS
jgi:hypothetical protein